MCFCPSQLQQARSFLKSRRAAGFLRFSKVKGQCARWAVWVPRFRKLVAGVKFIQRQNAGSDGSDIALVFPLYLKEHQHTWIQMVVDIVEHIKLGHSYRSVFALFLGKDCV
jgi:hypothetical protein